MRRTLLLAAFCGGLALAAGCGDSEPMGDVAGEVLVDGAPAPKGTYITFTPVNGAKSPQGAEVAEGKYRLRIGTGPAKVAVRAPKQVGTKKLYPTPQSPVAPIFEESLPAKYNEKTELTHDVAAGEQSKDWDLTSRDAKKK